MPSNSHLLLESRYTKRRTSSSFVACRHLDRRFPPDPGPFGPTIEGGPESSDVSPDTGSPDLYPVAPRRTGHLSWLHVDCRNLWFVEEMDGFLVGGLWSVEMTQWGNSKEGHKLYHCRCQWRCSLRITFGEQNMKCLTLSSWFLFKAGRGTFKAKRGLFCGCPNCSRGASSTTFQFSAPSTFSSAMWDTLLAL